MPMTSSQSKQLNLVSTKWANVLVFFGVLIVLPICTHLLFSPYGYNPTDDGFTQAYSRRILEGQFPHRDFIIIRPPLSPVFHIPEVLWGGDYLYLVSRLIVWFQFACISLLWVYIFEKMLGQSFDPIQRAFYSLIAYVTVGCTLTLMSAWHTTDGVFVSSLGIFLSIHQKPTCKISGYFIMSLSYLCKQNFLFVPFLAIFIISDWRKIQYWLAIVAPGIIYILLLILVGALPDAVTQLTSHSDLIRSGVIAYISPACLLGIIFGYLGARLANDDPPIRLAFLDDNLKQKIGILMLSVMLVVGTAVASTLGYFSFHGAIGLFGVMVGMLAYWILDCQQKDYNLIRLGLLVLVLAWTSSVSVGARTPASLVGVMLTFIIAYIYPTLREKLKPLVFYTYLFTVVSLLSFSFIVNHCRSGYRCECLAKLTYKLDNVFPGGKGIYTDRNNYDFLAALKETVDISQKYGKTYAIIPDCPGWWAAAQQKNPLSIDWPQITELKNTKLLDRIVGDLESHRSENAVIVQKVAARSLSTKEPSDVQVFPVVEYVRSHFEKVYETPLFEIYK